MKPAALPRALSPVLPAADASIPLPRDSEHRLGYWSVRYRFVGLVMLALFVMLASCLALAPARANGLAVAATASSTSAKTEPPAKPAPTIIPGSPLAALTGAAPPPAATAAPVQAAAPFGTQSIGFALTTALGHGTFQGINDFVDALKRSTRLVPVVRWGSDFFRSSRRQADALTILKGLVIVILPGVALDILASWLLRGLMRQCARYATPRVDEYLAASGAAGSGPAIPLRLTLKGWFRRLAYAMLRFFLMLVPLVVFLVFVLLMLGTDLVTNRAAHLAATGLTNAYICARLAQTILQLLLAPKMVNLRLIRMPTPYVHWAMCRGLVLVGTIVIGFCLISGAEILGLTTNGAETLFRLLGLVVHLELALWVWQSRRVIGRWIAGRNSGNGVLAGLRQRFAKVWYIFALFYLIGLWVAWAGGVHNALAVILRAVLVILAALVLARLAWVGCNLALKRAFPDEEDKPCSEPVAFRKRFRSYNSLIRLIVRIFIVALVTCLVLQGWGINAFNWVLVNPIGRALLSTFTSILLTAIAAVLVWEFCNHLLDRQISTLSSTGRIRQATRLRTLTPMLRAALAVVVVMLALIIGLSRIGVNTTGLLAVSSVVGIAVGFGSQKLVQDVITGLFLLFEDAMQVGDSVTLGGMSGTVERLSIRTIRLRGGDGSVNIIPFSSVSTVTNQTRDFSYAQLSIMVGYKENIDRVVALLQKIGAEMRAEPNWEAMIRDDVQIFGLDAFGELGLVITGQVRTGPGQHATVRREFQARVQKRFLEEGIELPYRHQTLQLEVPPGEIEITRHEASASDIAAGKNPAG